MVRDASTPSHARSGGNRLIRGWSGPGGSVAQGVRAFTPSDVDWYRASSVSGDQTWSWHGGSADMPPNSSA